MLLLLTLFLSFFGALHSGPLASASACRNGGAPMVLLQPLSFCGYSAGLITCCDAATDAVLREKYEAVMTHVPAAAGSSQFSTMLKTLVCSECIPSAYPRPVTIQSPPSSSSSSSSAYAAAAGHLSPQHQQQQHGGGDGLLCVERVAGGGDYLGMAPLPGGSGRALLYDDRKIWLTMPLPAPGSGAALKIDGDGLTPFLDLTDRAHRLMGLALHPSFVTNNRFYVSYVCDTIVMAAFSGAAGNNHHGGSSRYLLIVEEFIAEGDYIGSSMSMSTWPRAPRPREVQKVFTIDLPAHTDMDDASSHQYAHAYGGDIFTIGGPGLDGYLFLVTGYGAAAHESTKNNNSAASSFLGEVIRFNIDHDMAKPVDAHPHVLYTGLGELRGCSVDSDTGYIYCAAVDEQQNEIVYLISSSTASVVISHGRRTPAAADPNIIVGGLVYRGSADPFLHGRYVYVYGGRAAVWVTAETTPVPMRAGLLRSAKIANVRCSAKSPVPCGGAGIDGSINTVVQDSRKDAFFIATGGMYGVVSPSLCAAGAARPPPHPAPLQLQTTTTTPSWSTYWWLATIGLPGMGYVIYIYYGFWNPPPGAAAAAAGNSNSNSRDANRNCCSLLVYMDNSFNNNRGRSPSRSPSPRSSQEGVELAGSRLTQ